jgi:hypothetical protein
MLRWAAALPLAGCVSGRRADPRAVRVAAVSGAAAHDCDVLVYGSTPGGVAAAIQAARSGCRVILACPKGHVGGMAASGLSTTDAVRTNLFGGLVAEFIAAVNTEYRGVLPADSPDWKLTRDGWFYEPIIAERAFLRLMEAQRDRLEWKPRWWLIGATVEGSMVRRAELEDESGRRHVVTARTFIDATYEGDLAAAAHVPCRVGREGREEHGEPLAGIHYMNWRTGAQIMTPDTGEPSLAIQAFCYRLITTDDPEQRVPIEKPATYDQHLPDFEPLLGDFASGARRTFGPGAALSRRKFQMNGSIDSLTSINLPGASWTYPEAGRHHRQRLERLHMDHAVGLVWFMQNDSRVPAKHRDRLRNFGLHRGEFTDHGHLPWQLYVRQGRRIEGRAIVTQHHFMIDPRTGRTPGVQQAVAIGEHSFDVHPCHDRRYAVEGFMEGVLWYPKKAAGPAQPGQIPWGAMLPVKLDNLIVPVAMSATHVAMSVLRMEPVWMTTGQIAGLAAAEAMNRSTTIGRLDPDPLPRKLGIPTDAYAAPAGPGANPPG